MINAMRISTELPRRRAAARRETLPPDESVHGWKQPTNLPSVCVADINEESHDFVVGEVQAAFTAWAKRNPSKLSPKEHFARGRTTGTGLIPTYDWD